MNPMQTQSLWTKSFIRSLAQSGVVDVVISPGYRNTPLVAALIDEPGIRCHSVFDERVAGFLALGQARHTGRPSLLVCTSGTAGAHYFPAILEARYACVPLLVVTADRPLALDQCDAPQTIDQTHLFGKNVRGFFELGDARSEPTALRGLCRKAVQAVELSQFPVPGPVHINFRAQKPLEPIKVNEEQIPKIPKFTRSSIQLAPEALNQFVDDCNQSKKGLLIAGPLPRLSEYERNTILGFAQKAGLVVHAEASSQLRFCNSDDNDGSPLRLNGFDIFLRNENIRDNYKPDLIIQIGATPVSKGCELFLQNEPNCPHYLIAPYQWPDAQNRQITLLRSDISPCLQSAIALLETGEDTHWYKENKALDQTTQSKVNTSLATEELNEGQITRCVLSALPENAALFGANGLPIRHLDCFGPVGINHIDLISQRGTSGIDGQIAGAIGVASVSDQASSLLVGDIGFLHDVTALANAKLVNHPLVIVVINNGGGRIFDQLPASERPPCNERFELWTTPQDFDFEKICNAYGVRYQLVEASGVLAQSLTDALEINAVTVINAKVAPNSFKKQAQVLWGQ